MNVSGSLVSFRILTWNLSADEFFMRRILTLDLAYITSENTTSQKECGWRSQRGAAGGLKGVQLMILKECNWRS